MRDRATTSPSSATDRSGRRSRSCSPSAAGGSACSRSSRPPIRCRAPCTSTTRSPASCRPPAIADELRRPAPRPPTSTSGATPPARRCCASAAAPLGLSRLAGSEHVPAARARAAARSRARARCRRRGRARLRSRRRSTPTPTASPSRWRATAHATRCAARYAVGCDGANSFVRAQLGVDGHRPRLLLRLADRRRPAASSRRVWSPLNVQICDPARPTTLVSGGPGRRRWEFMRLPGRERSRI